MEGKPGGKWDGGRGVREFYLFLSVRFCLRENFALWLDGGISLGIRYRRFDGIVLGRPLID